MNEYIDEEEEAYIEQPLGFVYEKYPDHVFRLHKALYGLKQVPRAWYGKLSSYLLENSFTKGHVDTTHFIKSSDNNIILIQIYVDDIWVN
ncbi:reverse transcriptase domain-containing protein [Serratia marcescens]